MLINLSNANLTRANLSYANLTGANLSYASLTGANFIGVKIDKEGKRLLEEHRIKEEEDRIKFTM